MSEAIEYLSEKSYDPHFVEHPLKRVIQNNVLNALSKEILKREISDNKTVLLDYFKEQNIVFRKSENAKVL
ncbi:MAG: hypothetical protein ACMUEM_06300 [Flavobacteriales bacterium AspAUS03]